MNIIIYKEKSDRIDFLDHFLDQYFCVQMDYLASDLLGKGLSPLAITNAVRKGMTVGQIAGLDIRQHFSPIYTQRNGSLIKDCKLSKLGYALVFLNADIQIPEVAKWQVKILESVLNNNLEEV